MNIITFSTPSDIVDYIQDLDNRYSIKFKQIGLNETSWYPMAKEIDIDGDFIKLSSEQNKSILKFNYKILEYIIIRTYGEYIIKEDTMLMVDKEYHMPLFTDEYFKELLPQKVYENENIGYCQKI